MKELLAVEPVAEVQPGDPPSKAGSVRLAPSPTPPRPPISDEDEYMIESFVTGLLTCPDKYHDCFIDSWIDSHPAGSALLLVAYSVVDQVEKFHKVGYARPDKESA